jgi:hypothetical protein
MLEIDPGYLQKFLMLNAYAFNDDFPEATDTIYLHYEYQDLDGSFARLENHLRLSPYFKHMYDPDKYTTIFMFHVPEQWYQDYKIFLDSKYSHLSEAYKKLILNYGAYPIGSDVYDTLYRGKRKRRELELKLDVEIAEDAEVASALNFAEETYSEKHKIRSPNHLDPYIWEP